MNYEEDVIMDDVSIDPGDLAEEWLKHPGLFFAYALEVSKADRSVKEWHEKVKTKRSELIKEAKEKDQKMTVAQLEAYYRTNQEYKEFKQEMHQKEYELSLLTNAVSGMHRREQSLKALTRLLEMEYWAKPDQPLKINPGKRLANRKTGDTVEKSRKRLNSGRKRKR